MEDGTQNKDNLALCLFERLLPLVVFQHWKFVSYCQKAVKIPAPSNTQQALSLITLLTAALNCWNTAINNDDSSTCASPAVCCERHIFFVVYTSFKYFSPIKMGIP